VFSGVRSPADDKKMRTGVSKTHSKCRTSRSTKTGLSEPTRPARESRQSGCTFVCLVLMETAERPVCPGREPSNSPRNRRREVREPVLVGLPSLTVVSHEVYFAFGPSVYEIGLGRREAGRAQFNLHFLRILLNDSR
jgi:hypothetical protein